MHPKKTKTNKQLTPEEKSRLIVEYTTKWAQRLSVPYKISVQYKTHQDEEKERRWAEVHLGMLPYRKARIVVYDELMGLPSAEFLRTAERKIFHEVYHLYLWPYTSFCENMFTDDEGKKAHLESLEEDMVTRAEEAFFGPDDRED